MNEYYMLMRDAVGEPDFGRRQHLLEPLKVGARETAEASGFRMPSHLLADIKRCRRTCVGLKRMIAFWGKHIWRSKGLR